MKILEKGNNWLIVTPDDSKDEWWESEGWINLGGHWYCTSCLGGQPRFRKEVENYEI